MIIYGGSELTVRKQLSCSHDWSEPCIDDISRYRKCHKCLCTDRDVENEKAYYEALQIALENLENAALRLI